MKIFLTGGTGFIGSQFLKLLLISGHEVYALKLLGTKPKIELPSEPNWIEGSLDGDFKNVLCDCDAFVHFAVHAVNYPYDSIENCLKWNVSAPLNLLQQAFLSGITNYLIAGTCAEYGNSGLSYDYIPTDAPLLPTTTYAVSKAASSIVFSGWGIINQVKMKYLRIFQVFGEGDVTGRLWPSLRAAALSGEDFDLTFGEQVRDFVDVKDVAKGFLDELDFSHVEPGIPYFANIGSGKPQSIKEFAEYWWNYWGAKGKLLFGAVPYRDNEVMRYVPKI